MSSIWLPIWVGLFLLLGVAPAGAEEPGGSAPHASEPVTESKFGLSEAQRQAVFRDLAAAEERAVQDAARQFETDPESEGQVALADRLRARYDREVGAKYQLDTQELVAIKAEGYEKSWPTGLP